MHRQLVLAWIAASAAGFAPCASAVAQDRGYGSGYDAGLSYLRPNPAYDPFFNEGAANPDQRYAAPSSFQNDQDYTTGHRPRPRHGIRRRKAEIAVVRRVKPPRPALWLSDQP